jgi:hypothetical protein
VDDGPEAGGWEVAVTPPPYVVVEELAAVDGRIPAFGLFGVATTGFVGVIPNLSYTCL